MIREKAFYKAFFITMITLALQQVITLSVNLADNIMLGAYSETSLSGVAAVNQIQFVYQQRGNQDENICYNRSKFRAWI